MPLPDTFPEPATTELSENSSTPSFGSSRTKPLVVSVPTRWFELRRSSSSRPTSLAESPTIHLPNLKWDGERGKWLVELTLKALMELLRAEGRMELKSGSPPIILLGDKT